MGRNSDCSIDPDETDVIALLDRVRFEVVSFAPSVLSFGLRLWEEEPIAEPAPREAKVHFSTLALAQKCAAVPRRARI